MLGFSNVLPFCFYPRHDKFVISLSLWARPIRYYLISLSKPVFQRRILLIGKVWIGGTPKKHIGRTPPPRYMEDEAMRQSRFILQCMKQLPEVRIANPVVKKIANNLYQVEVDIVNDKTYPTASDRSVLLKRYTPDVLEASVKGGTLVEPGNTKVTEETALRAGYIKPANVAGKSMEFRTRGNSTTTFRYTVATTNPGSASLTLNLKSIGGNENLTVKLQ